MMNIEDIYNISKQIQQLGFYLLRSFSQDFPLTGTYCGLPYRRV